MSFYQTIFLSFVLGVCLIWIVGKLYPTDKKQPHGWQRPLLVLAGFTMVSVILWLLLQVLIGLPSLAQTIDLPAIFLGLLIAYGFQSAVTAIQDRAKNKFK